MPKKSFDQKAAEDHAQQRARAQRRGEHFAVSWTIDGLGYGPLYFRTFDEAAGRREWMLK
jgi:hypothetical protein